MVIKVSVDGEAVTADFPLVARRAPLAASQHPGVTLCPEQLSGALAFFCAVNNQYR